MKKAKRDPEKELRHRTRIDRFYSGLGSVGKGVFVLFCIATFMFGVHQLVMGLSAGEPGALGGLLGATIMAFIIHYSHNADRVDELKKLVESEISSEES